MGCGASDLNPTKKNVANERKRRQKQSISAGEGLPNRNPLHGRGHADSAAVGGGVLVMQTVDQGVDEDAFNPQQNGKSSLLGKQRYIGESGAVVMAKEEQGKSGKLIRGHLIVFTNESRSNLVFVFAEMNNGPLYVKEFYNDDELAKAKQDASVQLPWAPFFKSIASDVIKGKASVSNPGPSSANSTILSRTVSFTIVSSKDANIAEPFAVKMSMIARTPSSKDLVQYVLAPMTHMAQSGWNKDKDRELRVAKAHNSKLIADAGIRVGMSEIANLRKRIEPLKQAASEKANESRRLAQQLSLVEYKLSRRLERLGVGAGGGGGAVLNTLDLMYTQGGPMPFIHAHFAAPHMPKMPTVNEPLATLLAKTLSSGYVDGKGAGTECLLAQLAQPLTSVLRPPPTSDPVLTRIYQIVTPYLANTVMQTMHKLEEWDYNVFDLEQQTGGNALFYTTYAILHRLGLPYHFGIDDKVLQNFLRGVQAGYHPNPYHNKTHAADVCQVNYYIMSKGGLIDKCRLGKEDLLAAVLAGAIHDYDHPGFNNNLHTRTNAYLSTLYNDRSILENHHLACVFEMMRLPQYDIFKNLTDEQRRTVRETMIEMVLATDMGNHARIFEGFKRTIASSREWSAKDQKVDAMCMTLKLADISNCSRPRNLYMEWAKNISAEFYQQGDAESSLGLVISPFMDRRKERTDFPQGQISFMNFIVMPMLEVMCELLPDLNHTIQHCQRNKDEWGRVLKA